MKIKNERDNKDVPKNLLLEEGDWISIQQIWADIREDCDCLLEDSFYIGSGLMIDGCKLLSDRPCCAKDCSKVEKYLEETIKKKDNELDGDRKSLLEVYEEVDDENNSFKNT